MYNMLLNFISCSGVEKAYLLIVHHIIWLDILCVHYFCLMSPCIERQAHNVTMFTVQMVSGAHRLGMTAKHTCCAGDTWYVDLAEDEMEKTLGVDLKRDIVTCEVPFGGILFLNNCIPHRSLENYSDKIRWSLDLRWQNPSMPNGFHGLKESVLMRKADDPNYKIDWEGDCFLSYIVLWY